MLKIMVVFGTRPEAIKMCPVVKELQKRENIKTVVCVTGQHKEMLHQVLDIFKVNPDYDLDIMKKDQTLTSVTESILVNIDDLLIKEKPDLVLVHGDTTTAFSGALASFYHKIPVGHVEAGLRTYNIYSPFPEEFNRETISLISLLDFAPTEASKINLEKNGKKNIFVTGNTAIDALNYTVNSDYHSEVIDWLTDDRLILLTTHRRENVGEPMRNIFRAVNRLVANHSDIKVVYPMHLNPAIKKIVDEELMESDNIKILPPLDVVDFHNLIAKSTLILTDSGGIQEEAPSLGKPVLVLRDTTERPEGVEAGTLLLVGTDEQEIFEASNRLLEDKEYYSSVSNIRNPYGDGDASRRICDEIERYFYEKN